MDRKQIDHKTTNEVQSLLVTVQEALAGDRPSLALLGIAGPKDASDRLATLTLLYDLERLVGLGERSDHPAVRASLARLRDRLESGKPAATMPSTTLPKQQPGEGTLSVPSTWRAIDAANEVAPPTVEELPTQTRRVAS